MLLNLFLTLVWWWHARQQSQARPRWSFYWKKKRHFIFIEQFSTDLKTTPIDLTAQEECLPLNGWTFMSVKEGLLYYAWEAAGRYKRISWTRKATKRNMWNKSIKRLTRPDSRPILILRENIHATHVERLSAEELGTMSKNNLRWKK